MNVFILAMHPLWTAVGGVIAFIAGACVGIAHFGLLQQIVGIFVSGGSIVRLISLHAARLLATGIVLYLAGRGGALPLLAALAGILAARQIVIRGVRGAS